MINFARKVAIAATLASAAAVATPASAAVPTPIANDPCSAGYVQGALACQGYYGGNLFQGNAGSATNADIQTILNHLLSGSPTPTNTTGGYAPPYTLDISHVLATFDNPGQTINFGVTLSGLTVFGAHFGNNTDSDQNNVSAFWLVNLTTPTNHITLLNNGTTTTAGTSNAQLYATGINSAVPEPATWALMLLGFGGMGVAMRRRRQQTTLLQMA
jgi:hypothetical protein